MVWRVQAAVVLAALALGAASAQANRLETIVIPAPTEGLPVAAPKANVLLPDGYDPKRAYPLLLLIHGFQNTYSTWATEGRVAETAKGLGAIVVMPEGGNGFYADWWNGGRRGSPAWESYILDRVLPAVRRRYRIRRERRYHAVVGVSMGGLGATYVGERLPGYFGSVGSLAGAVDTEIYPFLPDLISVLAGTSPPNVMGPAFYARGHNPTRLAANLAQSRVFVAAGDGLPDGRGVSDLNGLTVSAVLEMLLRPMSDEFVRALRAAGADVTYHPGAGPHDWKYFRDELRDAIRWGPFEPVDEHPSSWVADTVATHGKLWDVAYAFDPPPDGVVRFRRRGAQLLVSGAHTTVTLRSDGRCTLQAALPADLRLPARCPGGKRKAHR